MYALATVHHILGEEDSVCLLLDTLLKIPDLPFFKAIPNLDSEAGYCQNESDPLKQIVQTAIDTSQNAPVPSTDLSDSDFDGIPNENDYCPNTKGVASNNGCPIIPLDSKFNWLDGAWEARDISQTNLPNQTWNLDFQAEYSEQVFTAYYDNLGCSAVWNLIKIEGESLFFKEKIVSGNEGEIPTCEDFVLIKVEKDSPSTLKLTYYAPDEKTLIVNTIIHEKNE